MEKKFNEMMGCLKFLETKKKLKINEKNRMGSKIGIYLKALTIDI
jgi:hypothetical protein